MVSLSERYSSEYIWHHLHLNLDLSFDNILLTFEMFEDDELEDADKYNLCLEMLITNIDVLRELSGEQCGELMIDLLKDKLNINLLEPQEDDGKPPAFDFKEDSERIYASFLADYNIDLLKQQGNMPYEVFISLLENLSEETPFKQAVYYRTCEIPKKQKGNEDERKRIKKLKQHYALKNERVRKLEAENAHKQMQNMMNAFL